MKNHTCLIVEDNPQSAEYIEGLLADGFPQLRSLTAHNLQEAETLFRTHAPHLLLLDINLPSGRDGRADRSAFDLLEKLHEEGETDFVVVFITAHAEYAVQAFRYSALDYLLKPFTLAALGEAVSRALSALDEEAYRQQLETFFHNNHSDADEKRLVLKTASDIYLVSVDEVLYARAEDNYTHYHLEDGNRILISRTLKAVEEELSPLGFVRVHQSWLVNGRHIVAFHRKDSLLALSDGSRIPVSQSKKARVLDWLDEQA